MKFGIFYSHQCPKPWNGTSEKTLFDDAIRHGIIADRIGIQYAWVQEHHFLEEYSHSSAPEVFLGALAAVTEKIRLGHGIMLMAPNYNHPARCAERLATLDLISGGRVDWGTGESGTRIELEGFNIPYTEKRGMWTEAVRETARMLSCTPYPGHKGEYFSMPARNIVPKCLQTPHPPIWIACSNRDSLRHAARNGVGALTFAFMDHKEAAFWVEEYYETFQRECNPIGRAVNPNVAMLVQFMCDQNSEMAKKNGYEGAKFFAYGLSHYYRTGTHIPARSDIWSSFQSADAFEHAGNDGIGTPSEITEAFQQLEEAGVDQLILLHQAGKNDGQHVADSLELFGGEVLPDFILRDREIEQTKAQQLKSSIELAMSKLPDDQAASADAPPIESYPVFAKKNGVTMSQTSTDRNPLSGALWKLQVSGRRQKNTPHNE